VVVNVQHLADVPRRYHSAWLPQRVVGRGEEGANLEAFDA
jgi:hypothetical protein